MAVMGELSRRTFLFQAASVPALAPARVAAQETASTPVTVVSYNVHHGEGADGVIDLQRIANVIRPAGADFVALQEVDRNTGRSKGVDQAQTLADLLEMPVVFGAALEFDGGQYGNALLTRYTLKSSVSHVIPYSEGREPRIVLEAEVQLAAAGLTVRVMVTHLDHLRGDVDRLAGVEVIERIAEARGDVPIILAGDLNATPDSAPLERLRENWRIAGDSESLPTIPAGEPARQLDYVLCRPANRWEVIETLVIPETEASDHRPLAARLKLLLRESH